MGLPIDSKAPAAKPAPQPTRRAASAPQVAQVSSPRDSYTSGGDRADYEAQQLEEQRIKLFVGKNRARGQDVGMRRDGNGVLRAQWNTEIPGTKADSYFASKQHQNDAVEFLKGEGDAAAEWAKSQVQNSPAAMQYRFFQDPVGQIKSRVESVQSTVEACARPKETAAEIGKNLHQQYVQPFKDGNMRGAGGATGKVIIKGAETYALSRVVTGFRPGGGVKANANGSGNVGGSLPGGSSGPGGAGSASGAGSARRPGSVGATTKKPKPPAVAVDPALAANIAKFPRKPDAGFGHALSKHGPKDQAAYQDLVAKLKPNDRETSWFRTQKDLEQVIKSAPDYLPSVLKNNPTKALQLQGFLANPGSKGRFGFTIPLAKNAGRGAVRRLDGSTAKTRNHNSAYLEYAWQQAKGGKWEIKVKTAYPVDK